MYSYTEVIFTLAPLEPWRDVLIADLGDLGFDGFQDTDTGVKAYIPEHRFDQPALIGLLATHSSEVRISQTHRSIAPRNWNAEWEKSFEPVEVDREVRIRADFHPFVEGFTHDIVITPRMAFGTGHHATTHMMMKAMLSIPMQGKPVCDLGCGTAVLAILAERLGASSVHAIDIDEQAVINARENLVLNGCQRTIVDKGEVGLLSAAGCGVILANIERNTLLRDMSSMRDALLPGGALLLSGFVKNDAARMVEAVRAVGMVPAESLVLGEWALIGCRR
jgi:ribosomal protein L11 methyltransferase